MAKISSGSASKDEKSTYPILKTQELIDVIGIDGKEKIFTDLTPEQQTKLRVQIGDRIDKTDLGNAKILIRGDNIVITGNKTEGKTSKAVSINIKPDDITKDYYNEVNTNDAGKEAPERRYFKMDNTKPADANNDEIPVITDKAGFDKLPSGTKFIYKGVTKIKS